MQKSDIMDWLGISGLNIGFLYVNFTHLLEVAQLTNIFLSSIATLASAYFTCMKIAKHYTDKLNKNE